MSETVCSTCSALRTYQPRSISLSHIEYSISVYFHINCPTRSNCSTHWHVLHLYAYAAVNIDELFGDCHRFHSLLNHNLLNIACVYRTVFLVHSTVDQNECEILHELIKLQQYCSPIQVIKWCAMCSAAWNRSVNLYPLQYFWRTHKRIEYYIQDESIVDETHTHTHNTYQTIQPRNREVNDRWNNIYLF